LKNDTFEDEERFPQLNYCNAKTGEKIANLNVKLLAA